MVMVGVDIVVVYMGFIIVGFIGVKMVVLLEDSVRCVQLIVDVVYEVNLEIIVFCYGGECFFLFIYLLGIYFINIYCDF